MLECTCLLFLVLIAADGVRATQERVIVTSLPADDLPNAQVVQAIKMAAEEFNRNALPRRDWSLTVRHVATVQSRGELSEFEKTLGSLRDPSTVAVMGLSSASAVQTVSAVAKHLHLPVITTSMSKRNTWSESLFPTLLHSRPSNSQLPYMVRDIIQYFSWRKVCVLLTVDFSAFSDLLEFATNIAPRHNLMVMSTVYLSFRDDVTLTDAAKEELGTEGKKCNIFVVGVDTEHLLSTMREVKSLGLLKDGSAWIFVDILASPLLFPPELRQYMEGSLVVRHSLASCSNPDILQFAEKLHNFNSATCPCPRVECLTLEAAYAYDATRALGKALENWNQNSTLLMPDIDLTKTISLHPLPNGEQLIRSLRSSSTAGVVGPFHFTQSNENGKYDVFNVLNTTNMVPVGNGSRQYPIEVIQDVTWTGGSKLIPEARVLSNTSLNILVPELEPFTYILHRPPRSNDDFAGVAIDIISNVSKSAGFDYNLIHWNGSRTWDEMVIEAGDPDNDFDLAIGSITVKKYRATQCDFTRSVFLTGLKMLIRRPATKFGGYWEFLKPFHWSVWLVFVLTVLFSAAVMMVLDHEGVNTERTGHAYFDSLYFTTNVFLFVHEADYVTKGWARIFLTVLQFCMLTLLAAYTANMATFLSNQQVEPEVSTYTDILRHPVASRGGTTNWIFSEEQLGLRNLVDVMGADDSKEALLSDRVTAYIADIPHIEKIASKECRLVVIGSRVSQIGINLIQKATWFPVILHGTSPCHDHC